MSMIRRTVLAFALVAGFGPAFAQAPAPVPALPDTERRTSYSISSSTCACAVNFALYGDSTDYANWLEVWVNGVNIQQFGNWTITSPSGLLSSQPRPITDAVLTFTVAQTGTVQIVGARRPRRVAQFSENVGVTARDLNQALTDIVAQNREAWDRTNDITGRAPLLPPGETMGTLPPLASRANMGVCFDNNGRFTPCVGSSSGSFAAGTNITFTGTNPTVISAAATAPSSQSVVATPQGRLSLSNVAAVTENDIVGVTTAYMMATDGTWTLIYDGTNMVARQFTSGTSIILDATGHIASTPYDIFECWNGLVVVYGTGPAWATGLTRGTGAGTTEVDSTIQGRLTNANALIIRNNSTNSSSFPAHQCNLRGSLKTTTVAGTTSDARSARLLSNLYNATDRPMLIADASATPSTYSTNAFRQMRATATNQVDTMQTTSGRMASADAFGNCGHGTAGFTCQVGIGLNSTTVNSASLAPIPAMVTGSNATPTAPYRGDPGMGNWTFYPLENGLGNSSGAGLSWGYNGNSGLTGFIKG